MDLNDEWVEEAKKAKKGDTILVCEVCGIVENLGKLDAVKFSLFQRQHNHRRHDDYLPDVLFYNSGKGELRKAMLKRLKQRDEVKDV